MNELTRPRVAITIGDPAGIGPEIVLKSLMRPEIQEVCQPIVVGDFPHLVRVRDLLGLSISLQMVGSAGIATVSGDAVPVIDPGNGGAGLITFGQISAACGRAAASYIEAAVDLVKSGQADGIATAPIHKEAIKAAGVPFIGHTEMLAEITGSADTMTMFATGPMRIFFLTRHVPLRRACELVTKDRVLASVRKSVKALKQLGIHEPSIAVAGLNPHCGDGGIMGMEEIEEIIPAVQAAQAEGIRCVGPVPADSIFVQAYQGRWDAVLSLYHDQGHIGSKCIDFHHTTSVTLGLPFIRTSVDHGTAFDIAGKGIAEETSMAESILVAARYIRMAGGGLSI